MEEKVESEPAGGHSKSYVFFSPLNYWKILFDNIGVFFMSTAAFHEDLVEIGQKEIAIRDPD